MAGDLFEFYDDAQTYKPKTQPSSSSVPSA